MCGIAGYLAPAGTLKADIPACLSHLRTRGPDNSSFFVEKNDSFELAFLHTRFSIIDLNERSNQPFWNSSKTLSVIFNGEIYNYQSVRAALVAEGVSFRTESDTEVVLAAYERWGTSCFERFDGFWAVVLYDKRKEKVLFARDKMGKAPFYYATINGGIAWASNITALFKLLPELSPSVNRSAATRYLVYAAKDVDQETFFNGIRHFPKGSHSEINLRQLPIEKITPVSNYRLKLFERGPSPSAAEREELVGGFWNVFKRAVEKRLVGNVPFAFEMSGGLDSSAIVAAALELLPPERIHTYTVKFEQENQDEEPFARAIHEHHGKSFHYHVLRPDNKDILADLEKNIAIMEEPIFSPGGSGGFTYRTLVERIAQDGNRICLSGSGGDELLGGYPEEFFYLFIEQLKKTGREREALAELDAYSEKKLDPAKVLENLDAVKNYNVPYQRLIAQYMTNPLEGAYNTDEFGFSEKIFHWYTEFKVPYWLRAMDRSLMSIPIEGRYPFFDFEVAEFCLKLPETALFHQGWTKWILRKAIENKIPASVVWRKNKMGFPFPIKTWMAENKTLFVEYLSSLRAENFFDAAAVIKDYDKLNSEAVYGLWRMVNFSIWYQMRIKMNALSSAAL